MRSEIIGNYICLDGEDFEREYEKNAQWHHDSASQGNPSAQYGLGYCYDHGRVVKQDQELAVYWYTKAAEQGNSLAQRNLGDCYYYGKGVAKNHSIAAKWYKKAANQESFYSRRMLRRINTKQVLKRLGTITISVLFALLLLGVALEVFADPTESEIIRFLKENVYSHTLLLSNFPYSFITVPIALISFAVHERSHAIVAYKLGDRSLKSRGRLSRNPLKHLDPLGTLLIAIFGFGWAKPVKVDPDRFEDPKAAIAILAAAGPISNFAIAVLASMAMQTMIFFDIFPPMVIAQCFFILFWLNMAIGILNSLPLIPLDGSKVLMALMPHKHYNKIINGDSTVFFAVTICSVVLVLTLLISGTFSEFIGKVLWSSDAYLRYDYWVDASSARSGDMQAQNYLGNYYFGGVNVTQDYEQAVYWYRKSAENGYNWGQFNLGNCYFHGNGVEQNYEWAVFWYRKAAEQGNIDAQFALGDCYYFGDGVDHDKDRAYFWFTQAAERGNDYAIEVLRLLHNECSDRIITTTLVHR